MEKSKNKSNDANDKKPDTEKSEVKTNKKTKNKSAMENVKLWQSISLILVIVAIAAVAMSGGNNTTTSTTCPTVTQSAPQECAPQDSGNTVTSDEAASSALDFINDYVLAGQATATLEGAKETNGVYAINVSASGQASLVYISKDGKLLFLSGIDIKATAAEIDAQKSAPSEPAATPDVTQSDKPTVDVFVMSYCPYGTQIEKGILPVMKTLGDSADINIKFVDYAMHGEKEVYENLRQYCIEEDYPDKYADYLGCFLGDADSEACLDEVGISKDDLQTCRDETDKKYKITDLLNDESSWGSRYPPFMIDSAENDAFGVSGSPTLVINGQKVNSGRDSQSLLTTICGAFKTAPEACQTDLSSEPSPSPGFGYKAGSGATTASCG